MKVQKYEIENEVMKRIKLQQSEQESKLEDFYKFKADVYTYLDGRYESLTSTYGARMSTMSEVIDQMEQRIRVLMD